GNQARHGVHRRAGVVRGGLGRFSSLRHRRGDGGRDRFPDVLPARSGQPDLAGLSRLPARRLGNRPGLTGLRAVAIAIVVARHAGEVSAPPVTAFAFGFAGVDIFFVLSGFLITSLLIGEWSRTGRISLRQFYVRRALRLLPALFAFLLVLLAFVPFQVDASRRPLAESAGLSAIFLGNIAKTVHWTFRLPHLWSLGMEEQFYLLWPLTLLVLLRLRASRFLLLAVALGGAIAVLTSRV